MVVPEPRIAWFGEGRPWGKMASVLGRKPYRMGLIALVATLTFLTVVWHNGWVEQENFLKLQQQIQSAAQSTANHFSPKPAFELPPPWVSEFAHRLDYADDFQGHIYNVTRASTITMEEAKAGCQYENKSVVNWAFGENSGWGMDLTWVTKDRLEPELAKHRNDWHEFIMNKDEKLVPYDMYADRFVGRGIVIVGGQGRSLKRVRIILRQLKRLGCKLPIEIHYWGAEMNSAARKDIASMWHDISFNNLAAPGNILTSTYNKMYGIHYHLKTAALVGAKFEEIIMMDSDNIPVIDPEDLFESEVYKEYGSVFWPDIARTRPNNPMWPITNTACRSLTEWELESGQIVVNKKKFFYHLQLAAWFLAENDSGGYYKSVMLGDKDTFRWAWHALKTKFGVPARWITSVGTVNGDDKYYCGHTFGQHHPDPGGPVAFLHGGLLKTVRKEVIIWQKELHGGVYTAYKQDPNHEDKNSNINVGIKWDAQSYLPDERKPAEGLEPGWCTDFYDQEAKAFSDLVSPEIFSSDVFESLGGYWMIEDNTPVSITDGNL